MKKFLSILTVITIAVLFLSGGAKGEAMKISAGIDTNSKTPVNIIVEMKGAPVAIYRKTFRYRVMSVFKRSYQSDYEHKLLSKQNAVRREVENMGGSVHFSYTYVFNGFSCTINGNKVKELAKLRSVKRIYPDREVYLLRENADKVIGADKVHKLKDANGNYITGKGIVVGVVDTGVDYNDKELGGGGFPNSKVIGGYDFADNKADPMDKDGHGTHVAGIIAGSEYGVAPDAKIRAYKVFSSASETTSSSLIVKGIDQAVKDKCDIINISIGSPDGLGDGSDPESIAVKNAVESGVVVVAAAGNTGSRSKTLPFPISSPGSNKYAIGVGASDDSIHGVISVNGKSIIAQYPAEAPLFKEGTYSVVYCGYGEKSDFTGKDIKGKIALVKRGTIYFGDKDLNAKKAGAVGVICFNNVAGLPSIKLVSENNPNEKDFIPFLFVSNANGRFIEKSAINGSNVTIANKYGLGGIASFSSNGPTRDFYLKPDLVAPGVNIKSTVLDNKLESWSGTSMASPFVAGSAALLEQAHNKNLSPEEVKAILMNTATVLTNPDSGKPFSPFMQGAGRVNVYNAVNAGVVITPPSVLFGSGERTHTETFSVKNLSSNVYVLTIRYKIFTDQRIDVKIPQSVVVSPSGKSSFSARFSANDNVNGNVFGEIELSGAGVMLHIPFVYMPNFDTPQPLENVYTSSSVLTPSSPITLHFTVGTGAETVENDTAFTENIADEVKVQLFNGKGKLMETLFDKSPIYIGSYSLKITAKDKNGNFILKNGTYLYKVSYLEPNEDKDTNSYMPIIEKAVKGGSFTVKNAPESSIYLIPEKGQTLLVKKGEDFWVDMRIATGKPLINISASIRFDPFGLRLLDVKKSEKTSYSSFTYSKDNGILHVSATGNFKNTDTIVRMHFMAMDDGEGVLSFKSITYYPMDENVVLPPLAYKIGSYVRPFDINNDKVVDGKDLAIFERSFGLKKDDNGFNPACDFNKDGAVDSADFFILARHFGETYP